MMQPVGMAGMEKTQEKVVVDIVCAQPHKVGVAAVGMRMSAGHTHRTQAASFAVPQMGATDARKTADKQAPGAKKALRATSVEKCYAKKHDREKSDSHGLGAGCIVRRCQ